MTLIVLGSYEDEHASHMLRYLQQQRQVDAELIDSRWFPTHMRIYFAPQQRDGFIQLPSGRCISFNQIHAVYWRCYYGPWIPALPDPEQRFIAEYDAAGLLDTLLKDMPVRWVNGWQAQQLHRTKPLQLRRVAQLGATIPATIITNDPDQIQQFAARYPRCIFKPVQGGAHAQRLEPRHLAPEHLEHLRLAPVTIQELIDGTNIRVFVIGTAVFACEIRTGYLDYRDDPQPELRVHSLPNDIVGLCQQIARELELVWTGIDFRLTPDNQYVFLEANPSPMFLGFERATQLPLTETLADLLCR
jgi:hypothetical protein